MMTSKNLPADAPSALTPSKKNNSNSPSVLPVAPDTNDNGTSNPLSQLSKKVHVHVSTGPGGSRSVPVSKSKRRRVSDEENLDLAGLTSLKLLGSFDSSYRQQPAGSDSDNDDDDEKEEEEDNDLIEVTKHKNMCGVILQKVVEANNNSASLHGDIDEEILQIPRAKIFESVSGTWSSKGIGRVYYLKDIEKGEYTCGMIRMSMMTDDWKVTALVNDVKATRMKTDECIDKPMYTFRVLGTIYALRFPSVAEGLRWKEMYDLSQRTNYCRKTGTAVDDIAQQMKSLSTSSPRTH